MRYANITSIPSSYIVAFFSSLDMQLSTFLKIADALGLRFSLVLG